MQTITTAPELRHALATGRKTHKRIGFVPTMGYLHDGHLALAEASRARSHVTVVSIFVNPTQFGPNEDLSTYTRDFLRDEKLCRNAGVAILFAPNTREICPACFETLHRAGRARKTIMRSFQAWTFSRCRNSCLQAIEHGAARFRVFWTKGFSTMRRRAPHGGGSQSSDRDRH